GLYAVSASSELTALIDRRVSGWCCPSPRPSALEALHVATALDVEAETVVTVDPRLRDAAGSQPIVRGSVRCGTSTRPDGLPRRLANLWPILRRTRCNSTLSSELPVREPRDAKKKLERWRREYNCREPCSALATPEYLRRWHWQASANKRIS